jgi:hypothetical protein
MSKRELAHERSSALCGKRLSAGWSRQLQPWRGLQQPARLGSLGSYSRTQRSDGNRIPQNCKEATAQEGSIADSESEGSIIIVPNELTVPTGNSRESPSCVQTQFITNIIIVYIHQVSRKQRIDINQKTPPKKPRIKHHKFT